MGEQESYSSSNPLFIVRMRNSRGKMFVYISVLGVLCFIVFLLSSTHTSLKELEGINEKCQQQRDSLSAQLQVVYEHKNRLEKSLQQEKSDHRHTKEVNEKQFHELEIKLQDTKDKEQKSENQISQLKTSYSELEGEKVQFENALKEQLRTVQAQKDKEIEKLQTHISELLAEKDKLEMSNNAYGWKVEQHASEINLCHLQHHQLKSELSTCQEQLQKYNLNTVAHFLDKESEPRKRVPDENIIKKRNDHEAVSPQTNQLVHEQNEKILNTTSSSPVREKPDVLEKPHIMPGNALNDGVLPKPLDDKLDLNKDHDNAIEPRHSKKAVSLTYNRMYHVDENNAENRIDVNIDKGKKEHFASQNENNIGYKDQSENHPQMLPPNFDNIGEKDEHAVERGEYGAQYGIPDAKQQVEVPVFDGRHNGRQKNVLPNPHDANDNAAEQVQDMMIKSPGDVNNPDEQNALHMPPQGLSPIDNKIRDFKRADAFMHRADGHHVMDDKNYEEDDDDRENDDEPPNAAAAPGLKNVNVLPDNDFDDQEPQDIPDNAKEEEGVVVAPK